MGQGLEEKQALDEQHAISRRRQGRRRRWAAVPLFLASTVVALGLAEHNAHAQYHATLSEDLLQWQLLPPSPAVRVIVAGTQSALEPVLALHQVPVLRWLHEGAVVSVDAAQ